MPEAIPYTPGSLMICGGGVMPRGVMEEFVNIAGGEQARIVLIPTASIFAGAADFDTRIGFWKSQTFQSFTILHTRSREEADDPRFSQALETATAVWFTGGNQGWITDAYLGTLTERRLHAVLERGGLIGGTSAGAAIMSRVMISGGQTEPLLRAGMGFLPGTIVDQHFLKRQRGARLQRAVEMWPGHVGFGVDEGTAMVVHGRQMRVVGDSSVTICLPAVADKPAQSTQIAAAEPAVDLVALSRTAIARIDAAQLDQARAPELSNGTLVMVGDGTAPREAIERFLAAAGGADSEILVLAGDDQAATKQAIDTLRSAGAEHVREWRTPSRSRDAQGQPLAKALREARGIWFAGADSAPILDALATSPIRQVCHEVLNRGGVVGGAAAGAAVQGDLIVPGSFGQPGLPEELKRANDGYERGFGLLPGVVIDHQPTANQQSRSEELSELRSRYPKLVGLEIEPATAVIVRGSTMEVVGRNQVVVLDRGPGEARADHEAEFLKAGQRYDFRERRVAQTAEAMK